MLFFFEKNTIIQNESSAQSSNKETDMGDNRSKRFEFLLKQTEIFSHFMPGSNKITPEKKKTGRKKVVDEAAKKKETEAPLDASE